jgi:tryptophan-rich sensory protein
MKYKVGTAAFITILLLVVFLIVIGPIITIWALNTLFPVLAIPYTVWTWLAVVILAAAFRANVSVKRQD